MALYFRRATGVFLKTLPFVALRLAVGVLFGIVTILYFGIVGWFVLTLSDTGTVSGPIGAIALLVATLIFLGAMRFARRYLLYMVAAGHIAVIAHIVDTGETPPNQIAFGTSKVKDNFVEASGLFVVDKLVKAAIRQFNNTTISLAGLVSMVPSLKAIIDVLGRAISLAASYIDEAILAHMFLHEEQNHWQSARDGVVLYAKSWKALLGSTLVIILGLYAVVFMMLLAFAPLSGFFGSLSPRFEILGWVVVAGMALAVYLGVLRPWVKTVVITTFLVESRGLTPDSETVDRLAERSEGFRELMANAEADESIETPTEDVGDEVAGRQPS